MSFDQMLSYVAIFIFLLLLYPLLRLFMEYKDERQLQYLMTAVKIPAVLLIIASGAIFIFLLTHGSYVLPLPLIAFLLDLSMAVTIIVYKIQLNPDGKFQCIASSFSRTENIKRLSVIKNISIVLTAIFVFLNYKTFFIPASYRFIFLLFAYLFFILSCFLSGIVSQKKRFNPKP